MATCHPVILVISVIPLSHHSVIPFYRHPVIMSFQHGHLRTNKRTTSGSTDLLRRQTRCKVCTAHLRGASIHCPLRQAEQPLPLQRDLGPVLPVPRRHRPPGRALAQPRPGLQEGVGPGLGLGVVAVVGAVAAQRPRGQVGGRQHLAAVRRSRDRLSANQDGVFQLCANGR